MTRRSRQIRPSISEEQAQHIAQETGVEITDASSFKEALRVVFPNLPEDGRAGAPEGNKNARSRK